MTSAPPRSGVAVWFVDESAGTARAAAHRALAGLLSAYGIAARPRARTCAMCGGDHGKPGVDAAFEFSLAHSGAHAVVATSFVGPVGVDLERARRWPDAPAWPARLDPRERATVSGPRAHDPAALLDCWTRHEATGKALGCGLAHGLHDLGRAVRSEIPGVRVRTHRVRPWRGAACSVAVAAEAANVAPTTIHIGRWTGSGAVVDHVREAG